MNYRSKHFIGILFTITSALIYGLLPVLTNLSYAAGSNAETFNLFKSVWAIPILGLLLLVQKKSIVLPRRFTFWMILAGLMAKGITSLLLYSSYNYIPGGMATTLHFLYPLFAALLGRVFLKKRLPGYKWAALLIASLSVSLLVDLTDGFVGVLGIICAAASGLVYAAYILLVEESGISEVDPLVFAFYLAVSGAIFSLIYGLGTDTLRMDLGVTAHVYMALAAITTSVIAAACFQQGIRRLGGAMAAFFSLFEPMSSCIFGVLFLQEHMNLRSVTGICIILAAVIFMVFCDYRRQNRGRVIGG